MPKQKKYKISDELTNMESEKVKLEKIFLDANNPRLEAPGKQRVADNRLKEEEIQKEYMDKIKKMGINDLTESIKTSGFWTVDRVVLRPLSHDEYVVVEGNRRIAALKTLEDAHKKGTITLPVNIYAGIREFEALIYKGNNPEIAWIIQGFRHTPGIKSWESYPKSKFLADFEKETNKNLSELASIFGLKRVEVTHLIRSYYAFEQAKEDEDYGDMLNSDKFGHFDEIILKKDQFKEWMGWDDNKRKFTNKNNLKKYLSWAVPEEEGEKPKIDISPITRDVLSKLIKPDNKKLLEKFESSEFDLRQCEAELLKEETKREPINISDIIKRLEETIRDINTLPIPQLQIAKLNEEKEQKKQLIKILEKLAEIIKLQLKNLK